MNHKEYAWNIFLEILKDIPANNCEQVHGYGHPLIDVGLRVAGGFSSARKLVEGMIGGRGTVSFGRQLMGKEQLPTLEIFADAPVDLLENWFREKEGLAGIIDEDEERYALAYCECRNLGEIAAKGNILVAKPTSLISSVYHAALALPRAVQALFDAGMDKQDILWAWMTSPLASLSNDEQVMEKNKKEALKGAVISLYVRGEDTHLKKIVDEFTPRILRLHNLASSRTIR